jgi:hypothetical protein
MPFIDLSILNQRQTPAFYADVLANRPSAGFVGRIFISTNTFAFFRDNGTGWDLIGGPGTGTVTGSGAAGQVSFWNGASSITGNNDLFWDSVNGHLGIGTNVPGTALQIDHDQNQFIRLNQTTATNDTKIAFQNSGIALWRIGNSYNAGANDFGIYDVVGSIQPVTVKKTTGQVLIGTSTVGSGKLVVASATGDNHIQIVGAAAPSLRIDSAESGPTKRIGIGLATAVNNFIQNSQNLDMCIFNGSTSAAGNMLFGIYDTGLANIQEAARISSARNFLIGTITDTGQKLQVSGTALITGAATFQNSITFGASTFLANTARLYTDNLYGAIFTGRTGSACDLLLTDRNGNLAFQIVNNGSTPNVIMNGGGNVGIGTANPNSYPNYTTLTIDGINGSEIDYEANGILVADMFSSSSQFVIETVTAIPLIFKTSSTEAMRISSSRNLLIGTTTDNGNKLQVNGNISSNSAVKFGTYGYLNYAYSSVNSTTKTVTINNTGLNGTLQINVGVYNNGAGSNSQAVWICGGYGGAGMLATEITRTNGANTNISAITSNVNSLTFTITSTGTNSDASIVVLVGDINNNIVTITIA